MPREVTFLDYLIFGIVVASIAIGFVYFFIRALKRAESPSTLIVQFVISLVMIAIIFIFWYRLIFASRGGDRAGAIFALFSMVIFGILLGIMWAPSIGSIIAKPLVNLIWPETELEPKPNYDVAIALKKKGLYDEAAKEIQQELEKFPDDVEGRLLLADLFARNLNCFEAAKIEIEKIVNNPKATPGQLASALNMLADLYLEVNRDIEGARQALKRLYELLPNSEHGLLALQRVAHLPEKLEDPKSDRRPIGLKVSTEYIGLRDDFEGLKPPESAPAERVNELIEQLNKHPYDWAAREELAIIYAREYHDFALAKEQLTQLIEQEHVPKNYVVKWLNLLADLSIEHGEIKCARSAIEGIIKFFPNTSLAEIAKRRLLTLERELQKNQSVSTIKLEHTDDRLGLRQNPDPPPALRYPNDSAI